MTAERRVLVVTPPLENRGGVAHYYRSLREHLGPGVEYFGRGGTGEETKLSGAFRLAGDARRFRRELERDEIGLVHLNPSFGYKSLFRDCTFLASAKRAGKRVLVFFRGWDPACARVVRCCLLPWFRRAFFRADWIVVLSAEFERALREMGYEGPITVETTVVPDSAFDESAGIAGDAPTSAERPANVLFLSRLERGKGLATALETHRVLVPRVPGLRLSVAGSGSELESARRRVRGQGIPGVRFLGYVEGDAKHAAYRAADVFLFPTDYGEGMPNAVLEAMAHGLPVVTRSVGGLKDFFEDERMGYLTDSRDPEVFARLVESLLSNEAKRAEIGRFNRAYAEQRFKAGAVATRLLDIYARLGFAAASLRP